MGGLLVSLGLLSSTFHLGHPERAWRAFSQWRSSWLSREGVAAVATYLPAGLLFLALMFRAACLRGSQAALLALGAVLNGLVHGHDLRIAAHRAGMESRSGAGDLPRARPGNGGGLLAAVDAFRVRSVGTLAVAAVSACGLSRVETGLLARIDGAAAPYTH
jgi:hypothetical protein